MTKTRAMELWKMVAEDMLAPTPRCCRALCCSITQHAPNDDEQDALHRMVRVYGLGPDGVLLAGLQDTPDQDRADFALLMAEMVRTEGAAAWEVVA